MILLPSFSQAQVTQYPYWFVPFKAASFAFPSNPPVQVAVPQPASAPAGDKDQHAFNGAWDDCGNLLFYVAGRSLYNSTGVKVSDLAMSSETEISVFPAPGTENWYFIVYQAPVGFATTAAFYTLYDVNTGAIPIDPGSGNMLKDLIAGDFAHSNGQVFFPVGPIRQAVSKLSVFHGFECRNLYIVDDIGKVIRYDIGCCQINNPVVIFNTPQISDFGSELELSHDQKYLAWSVTRTINNANGPGPVINVLEIANTSNFVEVELPGIWENISGIEFDASGERIMATIECMDPFTMDNGAWLIDFQGPPHNNPNFSAQPGTDAFSRSQVELARNGYWYVSNTQQLLAVDPMTFSVNSANTINFSNTSVVPPNNVTILPDQVDGEVFLFNPNCDGGGNTGGGDDGEPSGPGGGGGGTTAIYAFPNPANLGQTVQIQGSTSYESMQIIRATDGFTRTIPMENNSKKPFQLNTSDLESGVYILKFRNYTTRLLIQ
ncbi:MAG: T9SS type A sorting domain-containing protein [Bacteroidia bacterium]